MEVTWEKWNRRHTCCRQYIRRFWWNTNKVFPKKTKRASCREVNELKSLSHNPNVPEECFDDFEIDLVKMVIYIYIYIYIYIHCIIDRVSWVTCTDFLTLTISQSHDITALLTVLQILRGFFSQTHSFIKKANTGNTFQCCWRTHF